MPDPDMHELDNQPAESQPPVGQRNKVPGIIEELLLFPKYTDPFPVYISMPVWQQLWIYACDNKDREIGGVLMGNMVKNREGSCLDIQAYLPGRHMEETLARLTFTHRTWNDINQRHIREHIDKRVVGWFHTHPGHGIFLSKHDLYIHQNYFEHPEQIAVVFDPVHCSAGFFQCQDHRVRQLREVHIYTLAGYAFDHKTRDFITAVTEHSAPECQPALLFPIEIDIQTGPSREARHQGLAFLLQLMDIQKHDKRDISETETGLASSEHMGLPVPGQTASPEPAMPGRSAQPNELGAAMEGTSAPGSLEFLDVTSQAGGDDLASQLGENLDLYSADLQPASVAMTGKQEPDVREALDPAARSYMYMSPAAAEAGFDSGPDAGPSLSAQQSGASFIQMAREVDEGRLNVVMKKLTPIKNQVARDLRQAEREILAPSGHKRPEYSKPKPYNGDFEDDSFNIVS